MRSVRNVRNVMIMRVCSRWWWRRWSVRDELPVQLQRQWSSWQRSSWQRYWSLRCDGLQLLQLIY